MIAIDRTLVIGLLMLMLALGGCAVSNESPDRDHLPPSQWATMDGDIGSVTGNENIYGQHQLMTLNGHDLHDGRNPRVKEQKRIDCMLRDCRLYPGQHSILVKYRWDSTEREKQRRKSNAWRDLGSGLLLIGGALSGGGSAMSAPGVSEGAVYRCKAEIIFKVLARHDYALRIVHTEVYRGPEEFQVVETATDTVVGKVQPACN